MDYYKRLLNELTCKYPTLSKAKETPMEFMEDSQALVEAAKKAQEENEDESDCTVE